MFFGNKDRGFEDDAEVNIVKAHKGQRATGVHDAVGPARPVQVGVRSFQGSEYFEVGRMRLEVGGVAVALFFN